MDYFSNRLDEIFEQGMPTKAQILDAYNKAVNEQSRIIQERIKPFILDEEAVVNKWIREDNEQPKPEQPREQGNCKDKCGLMNSENCNTCPDLDCGIYKESEGEGEEDHIHHFYDGVCKHCGKKMDYTNAC